jgi:hypothetical protein
MLGDLDPWAIATRTIQDPFGRSAASFADCAARLDRCVEALVDAWS